jgi:hypothetical protein
MNLDTPHLVQFISRTPRFKEPKETHVSLDPAEVQLYRVSDGYGNIERLCGISYGGSVPQLSSIVQICTMCFPPLPTVENLRLRVFGGYSDRNDDVNQWLKLLRPFTTVKSLYISKGFERKMMSALQELAGGRTTEVLPSLQNIFLVRFEPSGAFQEVIRQFVAARQLSGRPIAIFPC